MDLLAILFVVGMIGFAIYQTIVVVSEWWRNRRG